MKDIKVGDRVRVVDWGNEYPNYTDMIKHMFKKYDLSLDVLLYFHRRDLTSGDKGVVIAIERHLTSEREDDILVLIATETSYNLIGVDGVGVIKH